ncbi:hypothetical protein FRB99_002136, partial [Tulasnella sp. 403]
MRQYYSGDAVVYRGRVYRVIQAHISQSDWTPDVTPALWGAGEWVGDNYSSDSDREYRPQHRGTESSFGYGFPEEPPAYSTARARGIGADSTPGGSYGSPAGYQPPQFPAFPQTDSSRGLHAPSFEGTYQPPVPRDTRPQGSHGGQATDFIHSLPGLVGAGHSPHSGHSSSGRYRSTAEWIEDAKRRAHEFRTRGPKGPTTWMLVEYGETPRAGIIAGEDEDGNPMYIARNFHEGGLRWASCRGAALSWGGDEIPLATYEVLLGDPSAIRWEPAGAERNARPVEGGYEADGKPLWVAQARLGDKVLPGKTSGWTSGAHLASGGIEDVVFDYN